MLKLFTIISVSLLFFHLSLFPTGWSHEALIHDDAFNKSVAATDDPCHPTATNLANMSLKLALTDAAQVHYYIEIILKSETYQPKNETSLKACLDLYNCALASLNKAADALKSRSYSYLRSWVDSARVCAEQCEDEFGGLSPLTEENNYFVKLCDIAFDISSLLG